MKHQFKLSAIHAQNGFKLLAAIAAGKLEELADGLKGACRKFRFAVIRLLAPFRAKRPTNCSIERREVDIADVLSALNMSEEAVNKLLAARQQ